MNIYSKLILVFVLFSFAFSHDASAQNERSLEVIAADTIYLKPTQFIYEVSTGRQFLFSRRITDNDNRDTVVPATFAQISDLLKKNNFTFWESPQRGYAINENLENDPVFSVQLRSEEELKRLYNAIKNLKKVSGGIKEVKYESMSVYKTEMDKRLYAAAIQDANLLASAAHRPLGQLISIEELKGILDNSFLADEMNDKFNFNSVMNLVTSTPDGYTKKVIKRLLFRFQLL